jgi:hypothetical protein
MTAEEKWDKLRAHLVGIRRYMIDQRSHHPQETSAWDDGYIAALNEVVGRIRSLDVRE